MIDHLILFPAVNDPAADTLGRRRARRRRPSRLFEILESRTLLSSVPSGAVNVLNSATISGWAFSSADDGAPINVIVTLDNVPNTILANKTSSALLAKLGSADHAFTFSVPSLTTGKHTVTVDAIDPATQLPKRLRTGTIVIAPPSGAVTVSNNAVISGWAFSAAHNADPVTVLLTVNGNQFTLLADDSRPDLTAKLGSADHGFSFPLPALQPGANSYTVDVLDNSTSRVTRIRTGTIKIGSPTGRVETFNNTTISGWVFSPLEGAAPLDVVVTVNGLPYTITADDARPDLVARYGSAYHGFSYTLPALPPGKNKVTVNWVDPFTNQTKRLKTGTLVNAAPTGGVDVNTDTRIAGWISDPDSASSQQVQIFVNGVALGDPFLADDPRRLKGGASIGFDVSGDFAGKVVEVFALDNSSGQPVRIWTNNHAPRGAVNSITGYQVTGWAVDSDDPAAPVSIRVDIDGQTLTDTAATSLPRTDVQAKAGALNVGFSVDIPGLTPGSHVISVYALDGQTAGKTPTLLGKKTVYNAPPVGHVDSVTSTTVSGWAVDPDLGSAAATVGIYVDNVLVASPLANLPSPGAPAKYRSAPHGFSVDLNLSTASHSVTVVVFDNRQSDNQEVVIADTFVNDHLPVGAIENVIGSQIFGWAGDIDAITSPIDVDVYVDDKLAGTVTADQADSVAPNHGFVIDLPSLFEGEGLTFGTHKIEIYAVQSQKNVSVRVDTRYVTNHRPIGVIESAVATDTSTTITGWAADPDYLGASVNVKVYVNGIPVATQLADTSRHDLLTLTPLSSTPSFYNYGFVLTLPALSAGTNRIDIYAEDLTNGQFSTLACLTIAV